MKNRIKTFAIVAMILMIPFSGEAQNRKEARRAKKETRRIEAAIRDSLMKYASEEELVELGYGKVRRRDLTTSVSKVDLDQKTVSSYTDMGEFLMGRVPGLQVTKTGDTYKYVIRSTNTIYGNTDPIFVVDGMTVDDISYLNPSDVDHVEVLKDAASAAIYGTEGGNGVILITTKRLK